MATKIQPPSIFIAWSDVDEAWLATAVDVDQPATIVDNTTSDGTTPAAALQALLEKRFCVGEDGFTPLPVTIEVA